VFGAAIAPAPHAAADPSAAPLVLFVDADDDDVDGTADALQPKVDERTLVDAFLLDGSFDGATITVSGAGKVRLVGPSGVVAPTKPLPAKTRVQGVAAGDVVIDGRSRSGKPLHLSFEVIGAFARDLQGAPIDFTTSHVSLVRSPPTASPDPLRPDADEIELVVGTTNATLALDVDVESYGASGVRLDGLTHVPLKPEPCKALAGARCFATAPLRLVVDDVDRSHPLARGRALRAEVGGALVVRSAGKKQLLRVKGPRKSALGPIGRYRAKIRPIVMRLGAGGAPAIGGNDAGAVQMMRSEMAVSSSIWGQCGVSFGDTSKLEVLVVDPPPPWLLAFGDDSGLPASSGAVSFRVDGKPVTFTTAPRATPDDVAQVAARAIEKLGFTVVVSPNLRIAPGAFPSVDLLVRRKDGRPVTLDLAPGVPLSTDPTLSVRIGTVDLGDGLQHFGDMDSMSGTLEERTLAKWVEDGDDTTVEVMVVPQFAGGGRIGESFIATESPAMRNMLFLDRAGVRARRSSFTVAHELGHVLLDVPGHPDDYDVDTPTLLMDSDASDASAFGPRRITLEECERLLREAGPNARMPLLTPWPLGPLPIK
jgi:hypothetical protein